MGIQQQNTGPITSLIIERYLVRKSKIQDD